MKVYLMIVSTHVRTASARAVLSAHSMTGKSRRFQPIGNFQHVSTATVWVSVATVLTERSLRGTSMWLTPDLRAIRALLSVEVRSWIPVLIAKDSNWAINWTNEASHSLQEPVWAFSRWVPVFMVLQGTLRRWMHLRGQKDLLFPD